MIDPFHILESYRVAVRAGGAGILEMFRDGVPRTATIDKGRGDFAMVFDVECQRIVRELLAESLFGVPFVGEEDESTYKAGLPTTPFSVLDPADGTHLIRMYCTEWGILLGYVVEGEVQVAVLSQPELGNEIYAVKGDGCFWNEKRYMIPERESSGALVLALPLSHALDPTAYANYFDPLRAAKLIGTTRALGCAAANVVEVLAGRAHAYVNCTGANIYDLAVGDLLIREAGGQVREINGKRLVWDKVKKSVVYAGSDTTLKRLGAAWGW